VAVPPTAGRVLVLGAAALLLIDGVTLVEARRDLRADTEALRRLTRP
jgi:hypothetical protein